MNLLRLRCGKELDEEMPLSVKPPSGLLSVSSRAFFCTGSKPSLGGGLVLALSIAALVVCRSASGVQ